MSFSDFKREGFLYQPYYCEENIWHLCQHEFFKNSYVLFIISKGDAFPMLNQRAAKNPQTPVFWDYHAILLALAEKNTIVDFDTCLGFVNDVDFYFQHSFLDQQLLSIEMTPLFKIIPSQEFIAVFCSDRRHMKTTAGWLAPPPDWPLIGNSGSNLSRFIDGGDNSIGELLTYDAMLKHFS